MTKILALIDGSTYASSVTALSTWAAGRLGLPVEIVHVLGRRIASNFDLSGSLEAEARPELLKQMADLDEQHAKLAQQKGRTILEAARAEVEALGGQASTKLRRGDLMEALSDLESDAQMVVIGKRGEAADFAKLHLGYAPFNRFLIAYDGGQSANRAVEYVRSTGLLKGMECEVLSVGADTAENRSRLDAAVRLLREAGFTVHPTLQGGDPEDVIQKHVEARGIGLLVMGAYGHSRIRSLIIGSTTTELLRRCRIPVLMFR